MNGVTFINHYGPNDMFNATTPGGFTPIVDHADQVGTDLGSIFNVEYNVVKGNQTGKGYATFFVTPTNETYIQYNDGSGTTKLAWVRDTKTKDVTVHEVDQNGSALNVQKTVLSLEVLPVGGTVVDVDLPIETRYNLDAIKNIQTITDTSTRRKTLREMQNESKQITQANLPPLAVYEPSATAQKILSEKNSNITYSRIRNGASDSRVGRFSLARYPDRDTIDVLATEYYLKFKHTKVTEPNKKPKEVEDKIAIMLDYHNQPMVTMKDPFGMEEAYTLQGFGTAKPPVKEGETSYTEDEVVYLDVINQTSEKQRIYLPVEKKKNPEFIKSLKDLIELRVELHNIDEVTTIPAVKELSDSLMNETFDADRIPDGNLSYKKDNVTYLYLQNSTKTDYLRLMKKDGESGLFINLDGVLDNPTATPPTVFPNGKSFEVKKFQTNGANIQAVISDSTKLRTVDLPANVATALFDLSGNLLQPQQIESAFRFIEVDENTYPNCKNPKVTATILGENLTGNFHYTKRDGSGDVTYQYLSYLDASGAEKHLQLIEKGGKIYGNFNTEASNPAQFETCLIESIKRGTTETDPCTVTYITGNPGQKFTGMLGIQNTPANAGVIDILEKINDTASPTHFPLTSSHEIESQSLPPISHDTVGKTPFAELGEDGNLSRSRATEGVALVRKDFPIPSGVTLDCLEQPVLLQGANPFSSGETQKLSTFSDPNILLTVAKSDSTKPIAMFTRETRTNKITLSLSGEQVNALNTSNPNLNLGNGLSPDRFGYYNFEVEAVQLGQNLMQDVTIKSLGTEMKLTISSQGMIVASTSQKGAVRETEKPLNIGVSREFFDEALKNNDPAYSPASKLEVYVESEQNRAGVSTLPKEPLASSIYESLTRQHRLDCIARGSFDQPLVLHGGTRYETHLYSFPTGIKRGTEEIFVDFRVGPDRDRSGKPNIYYFGHVTREHTIDATRTTATMPKYHKIESGCFAEGNVSAASAVGVRPTKNVIKPVLQLETKLEGSTKRTIYFDLPTDYATYGTDGNQKARDILDFLQRQNIYTSSSAQNMQRDFGGGKSALVYTQDPSSISTYIDDNVAQLQRAPSTQVSYDAVENIGDATAEPLHNFEQIQSPDERKIGPSRDEIKPDVAPKKESRQLWKGIKKENRPTWIGLCALVTIFSVFLPILGIVSGAMLGIIVASDSEIFSNIMIGQRNYRQPNATLHGRMIEMSMNKNKKRIRNYTEFISSVQAKINKVNADTKLTPAEKSAKLAKLNREKALFEGERNKLITENARLGVDLAKNADKELRSLKKEQIEVKEKIDRVDSIVSLYYLVESPDKTNATAVGDQLNILNTLIADKDNKNIRKNLEQQKVYLLDVWKNELGRSLDATQTKEFNTLSKKYDFDEREAQELRDLEEKRETGTLSKEELERLKKLRELYGKSPLAALREYFSDVSSNVDRREEEISAMATRYAEEHPENGWRDFKFEEEKNAVQSDENSAYAEEIERKKANTGKGFFSEKSAGGRGAR